MIPDPKSPSYRYVIGGLTLWAHFAAGLNFQAVSPLLPLITADYGLNNTAGSLLVALVLVIFAAFGLPGGIVVGRLGLRRVYTVSWLMIGLLTLSALSPSFGGLLTLRIIYGLGMAMIMPATGPLIMGWFRPKEMPVITSLNIAAMTLGIMVSTSTAAPLAEHLGWDRTLGVFGAVGLAGFFAWLIWGRVGVASPGLSNILSWAIIRQVLRTRAILLLGLADSAAFAQYVALTSWLPTFYNESRDMSLTEAGLIASALPLAGVFAVLLGGFLALKVSSRRMFFIIPGIMVGVGGFGSALVDNTTITLISVSLLGIGSWLYVPMLLVLPMELPGMTPPKVAVAWGWIMTASGVGGFIAPLVVGGLRDIVGSFIPGFLVFAVIAWFLFIAGLLLPNLQASQGHVTDMATSSEAA